MVKPDKGTNAVVQVCRNDMVLGDPASVDPIKGTFTLTEKTAANDKIVAQMISTDNAGSKSYGPASAEVRVGSCSKAASPASPDSAAPTLSISTDKAGKLTYKGTLKNVKNGMVRICVNDQQVAKGMPVPVEANGTFDGGTNTFDAKAGDVVVAQAVLTNGTQHGPLSNEVAIGKCSDIVNGNVSVKVTVDPMDVGSVRVSGNTNQKGGTVRICVGDNQVATATTGDGNFLAKLSSAVKPGQLVSVQPITSAPGTFPRSYGLPTTVQPKFAYSGVIADFVGGVEQGGYSSQSSNTNGFLSAFFRSPYFNFPNHTQATSLWGRIRLLSGPLPSTVNVVAAITNPTGTITSSNLANVGQVVDYVFGPEMRLKQWDSQDGNTDRIIAVQVS